MTSTSSSSSSSNGIKSAIKDLEKNQEYVIDDESRYDNVSRRGNKVRNERKSFYDGGEKIIIPEERNSAIIKSKNNNNSKNPKIWMKTIVRGNGNFTPEIQYYNNYLHRRKNPRKNYYNDYATTTTRSRFPSTTSTSTTRKPEIGKIYILAPPPKRFHNRYNKYPNYNQNESGSKKWKNENLTWHQNVWFNRTSVPRHDFNYSVWNKRENNKNKDRR
ncbi:hypothetical protein Phum_PHUM394250 [Pediculus humanus corporis]|uniref:Uncharacterized protein n=1 Tax=Pediculus humanus subsp. corporis TaxID=121224 RepID=E0VR71_PEDHC|nr:uncharacterized protein Phum_PHUM394250 [Pediculus humanus corporis]EEB15877.1 hypothetical protein Phum_PHUM394250 [Pediculus humanus corporis]